MKASRTAAVLAALVAMAVASDLATADPLVDEPAAADSQMTGESGACPGKCDAIYVQAEALFLGRINRDRDQPLVLTTPGETLLTTRDLDFQFVTSPRLLVGLRGCDDRAWEASYFGLHHWRAAAVASSENNLRIPGDLALATLDYFDADTIGVSYSSQLHNFEINRVTPFHRCSLLVGFRYLNLNEQFNLHAIDSDSGASDYRIHARNNLFGAQLGARIERRWRCFDWELTGKAGVFGNVGRQATWMGDFDNTVILRDSATTRGNVAFVGDLNCTLLFRLNDIWTIRGGYTLMWVEGLALATDQLDFTDTVTSGTAVRNGGGVFLHGANVGLEARW